ncbi:MAG: hypothetical protein U0271_34665 [Polyangiaceae bacterium]
MQPPRDAPNPVDPIRTEEDPRQLAARLVNAIYRLVKACQLHSETNAAVSAVIEYVITSSRDYCERCSVAAASILFTEHAVFVNRQMLKTSRETYQLAVELGALLEPAGVTEITLAREIGPQEVGEFGRLMAEFLREGRRSPRFDGGWDTLKLRLVRGLGGGVAMTPPVRAARTYAAGLMILRGFYADLRQGKYELKQGIKRLAQKLSSQSDSGGRLLLSVAAAPPADADRAHILLSSAIVAVAMVSQLTSERGTVAALASAALLYDVGRQRLVGYDEEGTTRPARVLNEDEETLLPTSAVVALTALGRLHPPNMVRSVIVHEALALRGVEPAYNGRRTPLLLSRVLHLARSFVELRVPSANKSGLGLDDTLQMLEASAADNVGRAMVKLLTGALGIFPAGTMVELSTGEMGVVLSTPQLPVDFARPPVRILYDADAHLLDEPIDIDLADPTQPGPRRFVKRAIDTTDQQMKQMRAYVMQLSTQRSNRRKPERNASSVSAEAGSFSSNASPSAFSSNASSNASSLPSSAISAPVSSTPNPPAAQAPARDPRPAAFNPDPVAIEEDWAALPPVQPGAAAGRRTAIGTGPVSGFEARPPTNTKRTIPRVGTPVVPVAPAVARSDSRSGGNLGPRTITRGDPEPTNSHVSRAKTDTRSEAPVTPPRHTFPGMAGDPGKPESQAAVSGTQGINAPSPNKVAHHAATRSLSWDEYGRQVAEEAKQTGAPALIAVTNSGAAPDVSDTDAILAAYLADSSEVDASPASGNVDTSNRSWGLRWNDKPSAVGGSRSVDRASRGSAEGEDSFDRASQSSSQGSSNRDGRTSNGGLRWGGDDTKSGNANRSITSSTPSSRRPDVAPPPPAPAPPTNPAPMAPSGYSLQPSTVEHAPSSPRAFPSSLTPPSPVDRGPSSTLVDRVLRSGTRNIERVETASTQPAESSPLSSRIPRAPSAAAWSGRPKTEPQPSSPPSTNVSPASAPAESGPIATGCPAPQEEPPVSQRPPVSARAKAGTMSWGAPRRDGKK